MGPDKEHDIKKSLKARQHLHMAGWPDRQTYALKCIYFYVSPYIVLAASLQTKETSPFQR